MLAAVITLMLHMHGSRQVTETDCQRNKPAFGIVLVILPIRYFTLLILNGFICDALAVQQLIQHIIARQGLQQFAAPYYDEARHQHMHNAVLMLQYVILSKIINIEQFQHSLVPGAGLFLFIDHATRQNVAARHLHAFERRSNGC